MPCENTNRKRNVLDLGEGDKETEGKATDPLMFGLHPISVGLPRVQVMRLQRYSKNKDNPGIC